MKTELLQTIIKTQDYNLFSRKYLEINKMLDITVLQSLVSNNKMDILLKTLELMLFFKNKKYLEVISCIENDIKGLLLGKIRAYDICISKILRLYYLSRKELKMSNDIFFNLMVPNKELGNEESVSVITNCLLDYLISNNIYKRINNNIVQSEMSKFNFYNGIIELVEGNYEYAYQLFDSSINTFTKKKCIQNKKYLILASLLQSNYNINITFDKKIKIYFDLVKIVKSANLQAFYKFLEDFKIELIRDKTFFIILRLSQIVIQEKIRCMSLVYSRISFDDMSVRLKMEREDLEFILRKSINSGLVSGRIEGEIYYTSKQKGIEEIKLQFEQVKRINEQIKREMKYPPIIPLSYDKAVNN